MFFSRFIQANYFKKYLAENAVNTISEPLDFKIFWGGDAPRPPYKLAPAALVLSPPHLQIRSAVPEIAVKATLQSVKSSQVSFVFKPSQVNSIPT